MSLDGMLHQVRRTLELNHYDIISSEITEAQAKTVRARLAGNPFAPSLVIAVAHVTAEHQHARNLAQTEVDANAVILSILPTGAACELVVAGEGGGMRCLTLDDFLTSFSQFEKYISAVTVEGELAAELTKLMEVYEEPDFSDAIGEQSATSWLSDWYLQSNDSTPWLVIVGEYGTGKTALTKLLQRRWVEAHVQERTLPLPFRIELKEFNRQFDARGLLHNFLDANRLSHMSVDYVLTLIREGKVVLLLDGYDEMAQFLSARERRACLAALADLSAEGARGILTTRPNYFTEAEELHLLESLYMDLGVRSPLAMPTAAQLVAQEQQLDDYLNKSFVARVERALRDLSADQTRNLVVRSLGPDTRGARVVLGILNRVFRGELGSGGAALSGKPIIISYLLEVVEQLKAEDLEAVAESLTEWEVYTLVCDKLMLRDFQQSHRVEPAARRKLLQSLAMQTSSVSGASVDEAEFVDLVRRVFETELRRFWGAQRQIELQSIFEDVRRSGTLTRASERSGWTFSHNSLREFLACEAMIEALTNAEPLDRSFPVTDAMRFFVNSLSEDRLQDLARILRDCWSMRSINQGVSVSFQMLWQSIRNERGVGVALRYISPNLQYDNLSLHAIDLVEEGPSAVPVDLTEVNFSRTFMTSCALRGAVLNGASFRDAYLEDVDMRQARLDNALFSGASIDGVDFRGTRLVGADFRNIESPASIIVGDGDGDGLRVSGVSAIGYLASRGAVTGPVPRIEVLKHHRNYDIVAKVFAQFDDASGWLVQRHGLSQRGVALTRVPLLMSFVERCMRESLLVPSRGRSDVLTVADGRREEVRSLNSGRDVPDFVVDFLART